MDVDLHTVRIPAVKLVFQLQKILEQHPHGKRRGMIEEIRRKTGLARRQITAILKNTARTVSLDALQKIVSFVITECGVPADELLGSLLAVEPSEFWAMFAGMPRVEICQGVRIDGTTTEPRWVNAFDAYLSATFIRHLLLSSDHPPADLTQSLIAAYSDEQHKQATFAAARRFYKGFREDAGPRALVCIGSMKSLPVFECVVAGAFRAKPFAPQITVEQLTARRVPLYFRYRDEDPDVKSVLGGRDLPLPAADGQAGVAFEVGENRWEFCPVSETEDVAVVFYVYRPAHGTVELALAGFSGRATGCIALSLPALANQIWPPNYSRPDLKIGLFVVRFEVAARSPSERHSIPVEATATEVIALPEAALARRLDGVVPAPAPSSSPGNPLRRRPR